MSEKIPILTSQQLLDAGLNVFGLQLFLKSVAAKKDAATFDPILFIYRGVEITLEPVMIGLSEEEEEE